MSPLLDSQTEANIHAAQTVNGIPPEDARIPFRNLRHLLSLHAAASPDKIFLIAYDGAGARTEFTYATFNGRVHQAASFLYDDLGIRKGDRVAVLAYNHPDTVILYFACWLMGAVIAPLNATEDDARLAFILRNSAAKTLFVRAEYYDRAQTILYGHDEELRAPGILHVIMMGEHGEHPLPFDAVDPALDRHLTTASLHFETEITDRPNTFISDHERPALYDDALLVYTSGTTGAPKGVVLTQYNLMIDAKAIASWNAITGNQRMMNVLPIHHVNGIVVTLITPLYVGGSVVLNRAFSSTEFWRRIASEGVHIVSVVPTLLQFALDFAAAQEAAGQSMYGDGVARADLRHFRHLICGAGTLSLALAEAFETRFHMPILHGYGLSETTCYSCFLPIDLNWEVHRSWLRDHNYPSIGCPIEANEMAIFSADGGGQQLDEDERGEICVRGHNVMKGYFQRPESNAEAFRFGWFRTGDEGFFKRDAGGRPFFFISGRIKELINRGGVKFSPFDIEEVLLGYPGVRVALAVGFPNAYYGEEVGAYIVAQDDMILDAAAILTYCRAHLTFEKAPKVIVFGINIPVTSTGKYQRLKLQPLFIEWAQTQFRKG